MQVEGPTPAVEEATTIGEVKGPTPAVEEATTIGEVKGPTPAVEEATTIGEEATPAVEEATTIGEGEELQILKQHYNTIFTELNNIKNSIIGGNDDTVNIENTCTFLKYIFINININNINYKNHKSYTDLFIQDDTTNVDDTKTKDITNYNEILEGFIYRFCLDLFEYENTGKSTDTEFEDLLDENRRKIYTTLRGGAVQTPTTSDKLKQTAQMLRIELDNLASTFKYLSPVEKNNKLQYLKGTFHEKIEAYLKEVNESKPNEVSEIGEGLNFERESTRVPLQYQLEDLKPSIEKLNQAVITAESKVSNEKETLLTRIHELQTVQTEKEAELQRVQAELKEVQTENQAKITEAKSKDEQLQRVQAEKEELKEVQAEKEAELKEVQAEKEELQRVQAENEAKLGAESERVKAENKKEIDELKGKMNLEPLGNAIKLLKQLVESEEAMPEEDKGLSEPVSELGTDSPYIANSTESFITKQDNQLIDVIQKKLTEIENKLTNTSQMKTIDKSKLNEIKTNLNIHLATLIKILQTKTQTKVYTINDLENIAKIKNYLSDNNIIYEPVSPFGTPLNRETS